MSYLFVLRSLQEKEGDKGAKVIIKDTVAIISKTNGSQ